MEFVSVFLAIIDTMEYVLGILALTIRFGILIFKDVLINVLKIAIGMETDVNAKTVFTKITEINALNNVGKIKF